MNRKVPEPQTLYPKNLSESPPLKLSGKMNPDAACASVFGATFEAPLRWQILDRGGCQNYGPFWGTLSNRCRIILGTPKGTIILTTAHRDVGLRVYRLEKLCGLCGVTVWYKRGFGDNSFCSLWVWSFGIECLIRNHESKSGCFPEAAAKFAASPAQINLFCPKATGGPLLV